MIQAYKIVDGKAIIGSMKTLKDGFIEYAIGNEPAELKALQDIESKNRMILYYKNLYLNIVNEKLKALDYDSLATVQIWVGNTNFINGVDGQTYGDEASTILNWYQAIITKNYAILKAINSQVKYNVLWANIIPTEAEYIDEIKAVAF